VIGYRRPTRRAGMMASRLFHYEAAADGYRCPQGQLLTYATPTEPATAITRAIRRYAGRARCSLHALRAAMQTRLIIRHVWAEARERTDANRLTSWGKHIYNGARRPSNVLADAKQLHGHRYARFRGLLAVTCQCLLAAAARTSRKSLSPSLPGRSWPDSTLDTDSQPIKTKPRRKSAGFVSGLEPSSGLFLFHTRYSRSMCSIEPWRALRA